MRGGFVLQLIPLPKHTTHIPSLSLSFFRSLTAAVPLLHRISCVSVFGPPPRCGLEEGREGGGRGGAACRRALWEKYQRDASPLSFFLSLSPSFLHSLFLPSLSLWSLYYRPLRSASVRTHTHIHTHTVPPPLSSLLLSSCNRHRGRPSVGPPSHRPARSSSNARAFQQRASATHTHTHTRTHTHTHTRTHTHTASVITRTPSPRFIT